MLTVFCEAPSNLITHSVKLNIQVHFAVGQPEYMSLTPLQWRHNGCGGVSNHQPHDCLLNQIFRRRSKETSKLRVSGLCVGNSPVTGEFPSQRASNTENVSIWWRHHALTALFLTYVNSRMWLMILCLAYKLIKMKSLDFFVIVGHWGHMTHIYVSVLDHH